MDDLKKLYFRIENPINNRTKWNNLIKIYSTSFNYENFYSQVSNNNTKEILNINNEDKESFYLYMWSKWTNRLLSLKDDEIHDFIEKKEFEYDIYDVINRISTLDKIDSYLGLLEMLTSPHINRYFSYFLDDFNHKILLYSDFSIKNDPKYNTVLSINIDSMNLYKILKLYIDKCDELDLPYYVKYNEYGERITIEIYSTINKTAQNYKIIDEIIKDNNLSFYSNFDILAGNIGYSITIKNKDYYTSYQYAKERSLILFKSFDSVIYEYILNHLDLKISYKDQKLDIIDYISTNVMEKIVKDLVDKSIKNESQYFRIANSNDLINLKRYIKSKISINMKSILKERLYLKQGAEKICIELNKAKNLNIDVNILMSAIRGLTPALLSIDSSLNTALKIRIKNECQFNKVDHEKFCLDIGFTKKLKYNEELYNSFKKEIEKIHNDINKKPTKEELRVFSFGNITDKEDK